MKKTELLCLPRQIEHFCVGFIALITLALLFSFMPQEVKATTGVDLYAKYISVDALTLRNSNPDTDVTNQYIRGMRICNVGDTAADDVTVTWQWTPEGSGNSTPLERTDCSAELIYLAEDTSPGASSSATKVLGDPLEGCGASCTADDFWDTLDVEEVAGDNSLIIPDYCHDVYFTVVIDNSTEAKAERFVDASEDCTTYNFGDSTTTRTTGVPARDYTIKFSADGTSIFDMETDSNGDGINHYMRGFQGTTPSSLNVEIDSIYDRDRDVTYSDGAATFVQGSLYDVTVCGYTNTQLMVDLGINFDTTQFEVISIAATFDDKANNPDVKDDIDGDPLTEPYRNNSDFWTFCDFVQDYDDPEYGGCRAIAGSSPAEVYGVYLNDNGAVNLKLQSEKLADCGITTVITLEALVTSGDTATSLTPYIMGNAGGTSAEWKKSIGETWLLFPTYASISDFKAEEISGDTVVQWTTDIEIGTIGYHLLRKERAGKEFTQLNQELLLADPSSGGGATYTFVDQTAQSGEFYTYKIIEIDARGSRNSYGPFPVTVTKASGKVKRHKKGFHRKARLLNKKEKNLNRIAREARKAANVIKKKRNGKVAKLFIKEPGLYGLSINEIGNFLGLTPKNVKNHIKGGYLRLTNQGRVVPLMAGNDGVYFYGVGINSLYTTDNVYWISADKGVWSQNPGPLKKDNVTDAEANFLRTVSAEENLTWAPQFYDKPEDDFWNWQSLYASPSWSGGDASFPITVTNLALGDGTATLAITLKGAQSNVNPGAQSNVNHAVIAVNGEKIGDAVWSGTGVTVKEIPLDSALLKSGENTITVTPQCDPGMEFTWFLIDRFELTYPSLYRAVDDALEFTGNGNSIVQVTGFSSPDVVVLDVTDPTYPQEMPVRVSAAGDGTFSVTMTPISPERRYHAVGRVKPVTEVYSDASSGLLASDGANYVIIGPSELLAAAENLASLREGSGMTTMLVDLEDVLDEFNYGIYSPVAIKDFLRYGMASWTIKPEYVLLVGAASFDYKDYLGHGDNLMPTMVASTPYGLFGSDNYFVDLSGDDGVPELAIGRIPARTADELTAYINKIAARTTVIGGSWSENVLMLADDTDKGGDFADSSNEVSALFPQNYTVKDIHLPVSSGIARQQVIDEINNGVGFVNYFGHASYSKLASGDLLASNDMVSLTNNPALPIMSFMTCNAGWFELAGYRTLAEELVLDADGGAVAVWTASGLSRNDLATALSKEYFTSMFSEGTLTIGQAIIKAKAAYGKDRFMLDIYNLMGDPALPIQ